MPIYDWKCDNCNSEFESISKIGDTLAICPFCNFGTEHRVMSQLARIIDFDPYMETDLGDKPIYIRTKQDLKDALARHNDGEEANRLGKLGIYGQDIKTDRVNRRV
uniref:Putative regulatory protein FmdB zinc ribbon domain-containing protein n=1 Tax=viral metagenome TaxID=1070528 RepID=A0A6M3L189_9ZZZZ